MDGFTGLNIEQARSQIENFAETGFAVWLSLAYTSGEFMGELSKKWASPNAVAFSSDFNIKMTALLSELSTQVIKKVDGSNDAGRILARVNGANWNDAGGSYTSLMKQDANLNTSCKENLNGVTGMDTENVKLLKDIFKARIDKILESLTAMPRAIEFYSTDGTLMSAYSTGIDEIETKVRELCDETNSSISSYIETEVNNILMAKNSAEQSMQTA